MKTVLFVCIHNSGRSQMAETFFNQLAKGRAKALSAGSNPVDAIDPTVVEAMREVGIDISGHQPKALTTEVVGHADRVVTMGCRAKVVCLAVLVETEDWALEDPGGKPLKKVREIRDNIRARVKKVLEEAGI